MKYSSDTGIRAARRPARLTLRRSLLALGITTFLVGCGEEGTDDKAATEQAAAETYARIARANYQDSASAAAALVTEVDALIASPSAQTLAAARDAWLASREPYLQTEVFRFYDGPIDNPESGPEGMINAWPLDEAYIDYVVGDDDAGIIQNPEVTLDADTLMSMNEAGGEENIATGYHAIEFLLWGQDLSLDGPGDRPFTDYEVGAEAPDASAAARRASYLKIVSDLLVTHLEQVGDAWKDEAGSYREEFLADPREAVRKIAIGMFQLAGKETGGERLSAALDTGKQEDEHSCFSDNTHRDMIQDIQGLKNVWRGSYTRLSGSKVTGAGLVKVAELYDAELADTITEQIATALDRANALQPPFDREIATDNPEGRERVEALSVSLKRLAGSIEDLLLAMGFEAPADE